MALASQTLNTNDFALLQAFMDSLRASLGTTAKTFGAMANVDAAYTGSITSVLAQLQAGDTVDTTTGLVGAQQVLVSDITAMMTQIESALSQFNTLTNRQAYIKFAGLANTL